MTLPEFKFKEYIFVVTGMSYIIDPSGTSKVVQAHEDIFKSKGIGFVAIFPISRSHGKGHVITTGCYAFVIDGVFISVYTANEVLNRLLQMQKDGKTCIGILVHHLVRNDINEIEFILGKIKNVPVVFYLHDFYTCCTNYNLLKNDCKPCYDGDITCDDCIYAASREPHLKKIEHFLNEFEERIVFVAPSEFVKKKWSLYYPKYADKVHVIPHQKGLGQYLGNRELLREDEQIRIGFLGKQIRIKGWDIFKMILEKTKKEGCNYDFYYFGQAKEELRDVKSVLVDISKMGKDAMINALRDNKIDIVLLISTCGETYSYTMYESHAANCFIITLEKSGNISLTVKRGGWGDVFASERELLSDLLNENELRNRINKWKTETMPGYDKYEDNDEIVELFPLTNLGIIKWEKKVGTPTEILKSALLKWLFILTRL